MMKLPSYARVLTDGRIQDTRYRFRRGNNVGIISGQYDGQEGAVKNCVFDLSVDHPEQRAPGYQVKLKDGSWVTLRWDQVKAIPLTES